MTLRKQYKIFHQIVIITLALSFILFGMPERLAVFHPYLKVQRQSETSCKKCGNETCNCCSKQQENSTGYSGGCTCKVSKDIDDGPFSFPENIKLTDNIFFQSTAIPTEHISKYLSPLNFKSLTGYFSSLKAATSAVIRI